MDKTQKEIIQSLEQYLQNVIETLPYIARAYRINDSDKIKKYNLLILQGMIWLNEALLSTVISHNIDVFELVDIYNEFLQSIEDNDYVLTADLLEFDFLPKFKEYRQLISEVVYLNF